MYMMTRHNKRSTAQGQDSSKKTTVGKEEPKRKQRESTRQHHACTRDRARSSRDAGTAKLKHNLLQKKQTQILEKAWMEFICCIS